jgi:hypothetical protein
MCEVRTATTITTSLIGSPVYRKQLEIDKASDGPIISSVIVVIRGEYKSAGITSDFLKFPVIFPVLREFGTAGLRVIGCENGSVP